MSLRKALVSGLKTIAFQELSGWLLLLVGVAVFFLVRIAGSELFGETIGFGLGVVCGVAIVVVLGNQLRDRAIEDN